MEIKELWPQSALADDAFLSYYVKQKEAALTPNSGMAGPLAHATTLPAASLPAATANADTMLPASALTPVSALGKAASAPLPGVGPTPTSGTSLLSQRLLLAIMSRWTCLDPASSVA